MSRSSKEQESGSTPQPAPKKRAPRKRASTTAAKKAPAKRAPRKAARKTTAKTAPAEQKPTTGEATVAAEEVSQPEPVPNEHRKAPTSFAASRESQRQHRNRMIIVGVLLVVGIGASAAVGVTDDGPIDVNRTVSERNERIRGNQANDRDTLITNVEVPVQNTSNGRADGGLVGLGNVNEPTPEPEPEQATSTASTTAATASSTASSTAETASSTEASATQEEETGGDETEAETDAARPEDALGETASGTETTS